jgi:hypothetical protein
LRRAAAAAVAAGHGHSAAGGFPAPSSSSRRSSISSPVSSPYTPPSVRCPLCAVDAQPVNCFDLIKHMVDMHKAAECKLPLNPQGVGAVEVLVPIHVGNRAGTKRRSTLVVHCPGAPQGREARLLWMIESGGRADGETQVCITAQLLDGQHMYPSPSTDGAGVTLLAPVTPAGGLAVMGPCIAIPAPFVAPRYRATLSLLPKAQSQGGPLSTPSQEAASLFRKFQWQGTLQQARPEIPACRLASIGRGLSILHPTHRALFQQAQPPNTDERVLAVRLDVQRIAGGC